MKTSIRSLSMMAKTRFRRAVTLVEVIFSMGVILIGLLGILAILPLAGRRAQDAISLSVGAVIGQQVVDSLQSDHYLSDDRLRPVPRTTGTAVSNLDPAALSSFCMDPMFASSTTVPGTAPVNGYNQALFPYYNTNHNPFTDPSTAVTATLWPVSQPRMLRVGVTRSSDPNLFLTSIAAMNIAESADGLNVERPKDKSLNATFDNSNLSAVSGGLEYGKRISNGEFTWFATVDPLPGGVYASVSVVVVRNRVRLFDVPTATAAPSTAEENAIGERLAYVTFASGFRGGAGGMVHLVSNDNTVSEVATNQWVMLSRNTPTGAVHRWFRIASVSGEPEELTVVSANDTTDNATLGCRVPNTSGQILNVWRHKFYLDGPDWSFDFKVGTTARKFADNSFADNTYATIASDVVSVTERVVLISAL